MKAIICNTEFSMYMIVEKEMGHKGGQGKSMMHWNILVPAAVVKRHIPGQRSSEKL